VYQVNAPNTQINGVLGAVIGPSPASLGPAANPTLARRAPCVQWRKGKYSNQLDQFH
jgi:hypothetical protein